MHTVTYKHAKTTKNFERFEPDPLEVPKDWLLGPIYKPHGSPKEDFKVTIGA